MSGAANGLDADAILKRMLPKLQSKLGTAKPDVQEMGNMVLEMAQEAMKQKPGARAAPAPETFPALAKDVRKAEGHAVQALERANAVQQQVDQLSANVNALIQLVDLNNKMLVEIRGELHKNFPQDFKP